MAMSNIQTLLKNAQRAGVDGDFQTAKQSLKEALQIEPEHSGALAMLGQICSSKNDFSGAVYYFKQALKHAPKNSWMHFDHASALDKNGETQASLSAYIKAWQLEPSNGRFSLYAGDAFYKNGQVEHALQIWSLGADSDPMVRAAHQHPQADRETREKSQRADHELRTHFSKLHRESLEQTGNPKRLTSSLWPQTHDEVFQYRHTPNERTALKPYVFYAPDLPPTPVFQNPDEEWVAQLQNSSDAMRTEYLKFMEHSKSYKTPYISANANVDPSCNHLKGQETWTSVHLYKDGVAQDCLEYFPLTHEAIKKLPVVRFHGQPMEVFFSILQPGIHIPPHFGLANTRVTAHLPLIIPKDTCRIRVADHMHHWKEGELFMFDDSFNHEAWNDSERTRVVLIFEAWRPDLSQEEIKAVQTSFENRDNWLKSRIVPTVNG